MVVDRCLVLAERLRRYGPHRDIEVAALCGILNNTTTPHSVHCYCFVVAPGRTSQQHSSETVLPTCCR